MLSLFVFDVTKLHFQQHLTLNFMGCGGKIKLNALQWQI